MKHISIPGKKTLPLALLYFLVTSTEFADASQESLVTFDVTVLAAPCTVNNNAPIGVDFGDDVDITRLGTPGYKLIPIEFTVSCSNIGDYSVKVIGNGASFDNTVLATDKENLGISLTTIGKAFPLNTPLAFRYPLLPKLYAQPVMNGTNKPSTGEFTATASMRVTYD